MDDQVRELAALVDQEEDADAQEGPTEGRSRDPPERGRPSGVGLRPEGLLLVLLQDLAELGRDVVVAAPVELQRFSTTKMKYCSRLQILGKAGKTMSIKMQ